MANNKDFKVKNGIQPTVYNEGVGTVVSGSEGYYLSGGSYTQMFVVSSETTVPVAVSFKTDGTVMYVLEQSTDSVFQYTLSTAWDVSTASYASKSFSVQTQDTAPRSFTFKPDGTKMYMAGNNDTVYQYGLSTAWDISTASYDSVSASVSAQATDPQGLVFKSDGTRMYVTDNVGRDIEEYTLSTAWDLSTLSHSYTLDVSAEDTIPLGLAVSSDGTEVLYAGAANDIIFKYTLTTAWDLSTASYSGESLSVGVDPAGIFFSSDGSKMYLAEYITNDAIYEYSTALDTAELDLSTGSVFDYTPTSDVQVTLSNPAASGTVSAATLLLSGAVNGYDLSGAAYDSVSFSVGGQEANPYSVNLNNDGTKMFVIGWSGDDVNEYTLGTAYDVSTASYDSAFSVATQDTQPWSIEFKPDGTAMYMVGGVNNTVYQYTLTTGFDISTASYASKSFSVVTQASNARSLTFKPDGTKMYILDNLNDDVHQYTLSTAWDVSTASYDSVSFNVTSQAGNPYGITFNGDGTQLFLANYSDSSVYKYELTTAYDISTSSYSSTSFDLSSQTTTPTDVFFANNGTKMYINSAGDDTIYQYTTGSAYTVTYDSTLQWGGGTAPDSPAANETDVITFNTDDGGTTYKAIQAIDGAV